MKLPEAQPDCVLLDLMLPDLDGLEVCRRLRRHEETEKLPVIMVTAKGEESDVVTGVELGADEHITKPFSCVLVARVRACFDAPGWENGSKAWRPDCLGRRLVIDTNATASLFRARPSTSRG